MRETALTRRILNGLNAVPGCKAIKTHGSQFGERGSPDVVGCYRGQMFAIEVKVERRPVTQIQAWRMQEWREAGATAVVAREGFQPAALLEALGEIADDLAM